MLWATSDTGKKAPLDPEPRSDGNIVFEGDPSDRRIKYLEKGNPYTGDRYVSHFATCPQRDSWRGAKR